MKCLYQHDPKRKRESLIILSKASYLNPLIQLPFLIRNTRMVSLIHFCMLCDKKSIPGTFQTHFGRNVPVSIVIFVCRKFFRGWVDFVCYVTINPFRGLFRLISSLFPPLFSPHFCLGCVPPHISICRHTWAYSFFLFWCNHP